LAIAPQSLPQRPHDLSSDVVSTHSPPQSVSPAGLDRESARRENYGGRTSLAARAQRERDDDAAALD